jgi:molybdopterin/thiamine biosynthesis adenylyltransferase
LGSENYKEFRVLIAGIGDWVVRLRKISNGWSRPFRFVDIDVIEHSNLNRQILFAGAK